MRVDLSGMDVKRIREIAKLQGNESEELTQVEIWSIINDALIFSVVRARSEKSRKEKGDPHEPTPASDEEMKNGGYL